MHNQEWSPDYLARALFNQDKVWITPDGDFLKVEEMAIDQVLDTLLMLERVGSIPPVRRSTLQETALYKALYGRLTDALAPIEPREVISEQAWVVNREAIKAVLSDAVSKKQRVVLDYSPADDERSERTIEVYAVSNQYIIGRNVDKGEYRTYRFDRIHRIRLAV